MVNEIIAELTIPFFDNLNNKKLKNELDVEVFCNTNQQIVKKVPSKVVKYFIDKWKDAKNK